MMPREKYKDKAENLYKQVDAYNLVENLETCLACGKCVGNCPVASLNPSYNPRQIISDVMSGEARRWLDSEEIWRCFWCAGCYTVCPNDIHFPLLMMQIRYMAVENNWGLKYIMPFKRFALRAREDGLTFAPSEKGREKIKRYRRNLGVSEWPEISAKAQAEYKELFDLTGTTEFLEKLSDEAERPVRFKYLEGRIVGE
ncbi:MAG: 4Fe-4S ferredoxin [Syntrophomonadaceae bacterium]|nr:4Fe-4S ferredoxin [Syntrophomonadaceae bacterium]